MNWAQALGALVRPPDQAQLFASDNARGTMASVLLGDAASLPQNQTDGADGASDDDSDDDDGAAKRSNSTRSRKIRIQPIVDRAKRQITFTKRKNGILKKVRIIPIGTASDGSCGDGWN